MLAVLKRKQKECGGCDKEDIPAYYCHVRQIPPCSPRVPSAGLVLNTGGLGATYECCLRDLCRVSVFRYAFLRLVLNV